MNHDLHKTLPTRGKLFGVMAHMSDISGVDPTALRVAALVMLCIAFKPTLAVYCLTAIAFRVGRA